MTFLETPKKNPTKLFCLVNNRFTVLYYVQSNSTDIREYLQ